MFLYFKFIEELVRELAAVRCRIISVRQENADIHSSIMLYKIV